MYITATLLFHCVVDDRNFALFNFVNEQNNKVETLRDQINQVSMFSLFDSAHGHTNHSFVPLQTYLHSFTFNAKAEHTEFLSEAFLLN